jgi:hypothetical protein
MKTLDANFKGAVVTSKFCLFIFNCIKKKLILVMDELLHLNKINHKEFSFRVMAEYLFTAQCCWAFPKNSWLVEIFDEKLGMIAQNGMIDHLIGKYMDSQYLHVKEAKHGPKKLNISQLFGSFQIWIGGIFIALVLFCLEHLSKVLKTKRLQNILEAFM